MFFLFNPQKTGQNPAPASNQTVKHHHRFQTTVTLQIEGRRRMGVDWKEAMRRVRWYLVFDGTQRDLTDFVFGK
jgi:hypothetical protein